MDEAQVERRLAAILVADIAGYSRLMAEDGAMRQPPGPPRFVIQGRAA